MAKVKPLFGDGRLMKSKSFSLSGDIKEMLSKIDQNLIEIK